MRPDAKRPVPPQASRETDSRSAIQPEALSFLRRIWSLKQGLERTSSQMLATHGLTAQQRFIVRLVGQRANVSPSELAELLRVDPGTVSPMIKRLEQLGLVRRRPDPRDGRRATLTLTAAGARHDVPASGTVEQAVADALARVGEADVQTTLRVLDVFVAALEGAAAGPRGGSHG